MSEAVSQAARELLAVCVCVAAMDALVGEGRSALGFRSVCAMAAAVRALRLLTRLLGEA